MTDTPLPGIHEEFDRGVALIDEKRYDEAIAVLTAVIARDPEHAGAFLHRGGVTTARRSTTGPSMILARRPD